MRYKKGDIVKLDLYGEIITDLENLADGQENYVIYKVRIEGHGEVIVVEESEIVSKEMIDDG